MKVSKLLHRGIKHIHINYCYHKDSKKEDCIDFYKDWYKKQEKKERDNDNYNINLRGNL